MKILATILGSAFVLAAGAGASPANGLYGKVTRGPITPMCVAEQPCSEPAAGAVLVFTRGGNTVARTTVRQDGTYRVALPVATYTVKAASRKPLEPTQTRVMSGRFRHVDFSIDTGIR